jgi:beta-1,4-N-acetylglucosaminyltransferase
MVILGSGGHTAEMLLLLAALEPRHTTRTYIVTSGDTLSAQKAASFERSLSPDTQPSCAIRIIPRARKVGQSWLTTPLSCVLCLLACVDAFREMGAPDVLVCNGPGSAVFMVLVALGYKYFWGSVNIRTIYVESFARTKTLSLSGRILYPLVDRFLVQWPRLKEMYPRAEYRGLLV